MTKAQISRVLTVLSKAFRQIEPRDEATISAWYAVLRKEDFNGVKMAVVEVLSETSPYPPTPGEILHRIHNEDSVSESISIDGNTLRIERSERDSKGKMQKDVREYYTSTERERREYRQAQLKKGMGWLVHQHKHRPNAVVVSYYPLADLVRVGADDYGLPIFAPGPNI